MSSKSVSFGRSGGKRTRTIDESIAKRLDSMRRSFGVENLRKVAVGTHVPPDLSGQSSILSEKLETSPTTYRIIEEGGDEMLEECPSEEQDEEESYEEQAKEEEIVKKPQVPKRRIPLKKSTTKCFPCMEGFIEAVLKLSEKDASEEEGVDEMSINICMEDKVPPQSEKRETVLVRPATLSQAQKDAFAYMEDKKVEELISFLIGHILCKAPSDPLLFVVKILDQCLLFREGYGDPPLLFDKGHQEIIYKALDPSNAGVITYEQYKNGLKTMGISKCNEVPRRTKEQMIDRETFLKEADKMLIESLAQLVCTNGGCSATHIANLISRKKKRPPQSGILSSIKEYHMPEERELFNEYYFNDIPAEEFEDFLCEDEFGEEACEVFESDFDKFVEDFNFSTIRRLSLAIEINAIADLAEQTVINQLANNIMQKLI